MAFGVMFHHFHDDIHPRGQGAISADDLDQLIRRIGKQHILSAEAWAARARRGQLSSSDICLTFDDALLCQYEIAAPVLDAHGLTAFWFVYSSVFEGNREPLELYRYFRTTAFDTIDAFYADFFDAVHRADPETYAGALDRFDPETYLAAFAFYSRNDRLFRFLRDEVLGPHRYHQTMDAMMSQSAFDPDAACRALWMRDADLYRLHAAGHEIGLHSYSHPTRLSALPKHAQAEEFAKNHAHLTRTLGAAPTTMSHPCNSYNADTLDVLRDLDVTLGFRSNMAPVSNASAYEYPRRDHADLMAEIAA